MVKHGNRIFPRLAATRRDGTPSRSGARRLAKNALPFMHEYMHEGERLTKQETIP